jgi:signal recognition particle subunit SRP54
MFEKLQERFESTFKKVRGYGKLTESNIKDTLREVRVALLEADVNFRLPGISLRRSGKRPWGRRC